jgi:hypothetical protein
MAKTPHRDAPAPVEAGDDTKRDQVLKRLLGTPHRPHAPKKKGGEPKPAPKAKRR